MNEQKRIPCLLRNTAQSKHLFLNEQNKRKEKSKDKGILLEKQREGTHKQLATQRGNCATTVRLPAQSCLDHEKP